MLRTTTTLVVAALGVGLLGCGAGVARVGDPMSTTSVDAPPEPPAGLAAPAVAPPACPFDLDAMRSSAGTVTYLIADQPEGSVRVRAETEAPPARIRFVYELRDERGYESGVTELACDGSGLRLVTTGPDGNRLTFDPPLLALPELAADGLQVGVATVSAADGSAREYAYRYAFQVEPSEPFGPLSERGERWVVVRSVLVLQRDEALYEWATETDWALGPAEAIPVRRAQELRSGDHVEARVEEARTVTR